MAFTRDSIPDLGGRVAVITGANGGLGLATAQAFAAKGAHVVMAVRDLDKAAIAADEIRAETPHASFEIVELDLGSQASVVGASRRIADAHPSVDILVNNAGVMAMPERVTEDGFEMQMGVDHLGHWTLTASLLPALLAAPAARVVTVSSTAHHFGRSIDLENPYRRGHYSAWPVYGNAKLANYHFGLGLQERFARAGVHAQSLIAHPGLTHSDLQVRTVREGGGGRMAAFFADLTARVGMTTADGAMPQVRAATDPAAKGGEFYGPRWMNTGRPVRLPVLRPGRRRAIEKLWEFSERETGVPIEV
ncbi:NAD(P)-dependent dehydrogenase (short-subunit alcohol dehydrogenase family) [Microbacterium terrae]|uniref:Serine 3-dehydrogenase n=1 Tax=Microbacterium terrae TaxID=69369 RepID=A0A0M2H229_9MICO|nr:oxidoreductase [Microbacterium terrae]KJL40472.1 Serine 3-dehydrogenase [Microbacterium terrae]MBP1079203.1 NAD(P)-dependent dehydrogenase (short-subunit alcohol dehydrogenase family) [Microbacterium terrae]GLJ98603.1 putative short-chain dehydrogenase/reductase [Microbacterium terrae]